MKIRFFAVVALALFVTACASIDPTTISRPAGSAEYTGNRQALVERGRELWNDPSIGTSGLACQSCHVGNAQFRNTFDQSYPHPVAMVSGRAGLDTVNAEQMVQLCMVIPMENNPLPWASEELAALTAYIEDVVQPEYQND